MHDGLLTVEPLILAVQPGSASTGGRFAPTRAPRPNRLNRHKGDCTCVRT